MKLELSARPDYGHALGALGGMVYNVRAKIGIFRCRRECAGQAPDVVRSAVLAPQDTGHVMVGKSDGQRKGRELCLLC